MRRRDTGGVVAAALGALALALAGPSQAEAKLKVGDSAPDFTLPAATRDSIIAGGVSLKSQVGRNNIILAFYPADWSGGCTTEMCTMRDNFRELGELGATVFGISVDQVYSHREWAKALNLPFTLLSDVLREVGKAYESYNPERGNLRRTVYVIDRQGKIAYMDLEYKPNSQESFEKLKAALQGLKS